jgi:hypothetical protein
LGDSTTWLPTGLFCLAKLAVRVTDEIAMSAETIPSLQQGTSCSAATKSSRDRQQ